MNKEIFKLQVPLSSNMEEPMAMIYNKNRTVERFMPISDNIKKLMDGRPKIFVHGKLDLDSRQLWIYGEAPWQSW